MQFEIRPEKKEASYCGLASQRERGVVREGAKKGFSGGGGMKPYSGVRGSGSDTKGNYEKKRRGRSQRSLGGESALLRQRERLREN